MDRNNTRTVPLQTHSVTMEHQSGKLVAVVSGLIGGMGKYLLFSSPHPLTQFFTAVITALFCGLAGAAGKHIYDILKSKYFKKI